MEDLETVEIEKRPPMKRSLVAMGYKTFEELKAVCEIEDCTMADFIRAALKERIKSVQDRHLEKALKQKQLGIK